MKLLKRFFLLLVIGSKEKSHPFNSLEEFKAEIEANKERDKVYKKQRRRMVGAIENKHLMTLALKGEL
ncbi:hypothetical protein [Bartonella tamiae]|uniref:Uncharacterized protein n=1 Tax=Bartonella tamiae Th239 TaxID=1094558 RepID=J1K2D1_9HYPH|nr:hypothetical protein [Bartonella tamiae]EJF91642.1 hypothetical protein ME5_00021 [Bartonella tamiae Th239]EJF92683.1 hypothetical protein MEG_01853 [Bartonella tamiae Th307]